MTDSSTIEADAGVAGAVWARRLDEFEAGVADVCGHLHGLHARLVELTVEALGRGHRVSTTRLDDRGEP